MEKWATVRDDWGIVRVIVLVCAWAAVELSPPPAWAQLIQGIPPSPVGVYSGERVPEGFYVMPWIAAGAVYDDNVLFSLKGNEQDDVYLRVTPGLQASYQSSRLSIVGNYRFDSEVYNRLTELNAAQQRQFGTVEARYRPSTNLTFGGTVGYAQTNTPFELNVLTAGQTRPGRFRSERYFVNPTAEYRLDPLTKMTGQYAFSKDIFLGEIETDSHIFNLSADRRIGAHDTLGPGYVGRYFTFSVDPNNSFGIPSTDISDFQSHALVLSWGHEFSADTRLDVRAGPRMTQGKLDDRPEAFVGIRKRIQNGELALSYSSAVTTFVGTVGAVQTDTVTASLTYEPIKHLSLTVAPMLSWIENVAFDSAIYTGYVETAYQFNKYMTAKASAYFSYQEGDFLPIGGGMATDITIARNIYWLRLEFTYPSRWE